MTEEEILKFWQSKRIFERSLEKPGEPFAFFDGPPFATGLPHYGHALASIIKDVIPRYQTMRGRPVARRWGWDCHGLPIENLVEKELGLGTKKEIEDYGIAKFNERARASVLRYADEWERLIPRLGRWVDMSNAYRSLDPSYTESVWWVFKTLFDKGLIYEGHKSMHLCPRCETTLANFEVNQGYKDVTDLSVYVKFELADEPGTYLLAWTTTPWTLPGNVALAVNPETNYARIKANETNENYILAESRLEVLKDLKYEVVEKFKGRELVGKRYKTVFDYYVTEGPVLAAEFVTTEEGTGIVHIAPAFGEDDLNLGQKEKLPFIQHVGSDGKFKPEVTDFAGMSVKPKSEDEKTRLAADIAVLKYLQDHGAFFAKEKITHPYPHCWRCETPLLNYAANSWFVKVTALKEKLLELNRGIKWVPEHLQDGRFGKWLEGARDWAISRSRFWGAPLPVWRCAECEATRVFGSVAELVAAGAPVNRYLVMRHGEAESNTRAVVSSASPGPYHLTDRGRQEVRATAADLGSAGIDLIVCSPILRARETADIVAAELGLLPEQIVVDERWREIVTGAHWEGRPVAEYHARSSNDGVETLEAMQARTAAAIAALEARYRGKTILIVTHQDPAGALLRPSRPLITAEVKPYLAFDFHRPKIDELKLACACGGEMKRVPEVFDVWFESGSMPYGQQHYPFEHVAEFKASFPADFIAEGLDQTRGWFYVLLVLGAGLFGKSPFKQVVVNGLILAEDGRKMSKSLKNYPELEPTLEQYGADALRFYLLNSPAVRAEELNFSERGLAETLRRVVLRTRNILSFYELYADKQIVAGVPDGRSVLDDWLLSRLVETQATVTDSLDHYELDRATRALDLLIDDFSTWYLRRSRERLRGADEVAGRATTAVLRLALERLAQLLAPFMPFVAEAIWQVVRAEAAPESVHLSAWPMLDRQVDNELLAEMALTRELVSQALELRAKAGIKVRQPLASLELGAGSEKLGAGYRELIKEELNVLEVKVGESLTLDTNLTDELREAGELRELIRTLQDWRKAQGLAPGQLAIVKVPSAARALAEKHEAEIKRATAAQALEFDA